VHVGVPTPEKAIAINNALATFIPHLLALSASSPFWEGRDTGLASARSKVFESLPGGGFPYRMTNWTDFQHMMRVLQNSGTIRTIQEIWWDIRPHTKYGTVEVRVCDAIPTIQETGAVAAFVQALVVWMGREYDRGQMLPVPRYWVLRENKWRAARFGLRANLVMDDRGYQCGIRSLIESWAERLMPFAEDLGSAEELSRIWEVLDAGTSVTRQRDVFRRTGSLPEVVRALSTELRESVSLPPVPRRMPEAAERT
jgi:carboxylate-amine ligase